MRLTFPLCACLISMLASLGAAQKTDEQVAQTYRELLALVDIERLARDYDTLGGYGCRLAGSDGERRALELAEERFNILGLQNIRREYFDVTIPDPDAVGKLSVGATNIDVYPLWPNLVRTSTCRVSGTLVYGGDGSLEQLRGTEVEGAIVLLEFNSGSSWRNAAKLGASAIIFIEPRETSRGEAEQKFAAVPLRIPRFYLPLRDAGAVVKAALGNRRARLICRQGWIRRRTYNLLADLPGRDPAARRERVTISAYADGMSVVPKLTPAAESAGSLASLLEIARIYAVRPSRRPVTFLVTAAHFLALQGMREYVDRRIEKGGEPLFMALTLDIDSQSPTLALFSRGWFYEARDESQQPLQPLARILRQHADGIGRVAGVSPGAVMIDALNQSDQRTWKNNIPGKFALDCEPLVQSGIAGFTLATADSDRSLWDTPFDTRRRIDLANVKRQVESIACIMDRVLNDSSDPTEPTLFKLPIEPSLPQRMSLVGGFAVVEGKVAVYDPRKSFVPDVAVPGSIALWANWQKTLMGVRGNVLQLTSGTMAKYRFAGVAPTNSYPHDKPRETMVGAFKLDAETGDIVYAPSLGVFGSMAYPFFFQMTQGYKSTPIIVFPCRTVDLYGLVDPQDLRALFNIQVLEAATDAAPREYGFQWTLSDSRQNFDPETSAVLFGSPGQRLKLLMGSEFGETRLILTNAASSKPEGIGYAIAGPPQRPAPKTQDLSKGLLPNLALQVARDYYAVDEARIREFDRYRIIRQGVKDLHIQAGRELRLAEQALAARDWPSLEEHAQASWSLSLRAHPVLQGTANDVVKGVIFYLFLLIPFSYFLERLVFGARALTTQLAISSCFFIVAFMLIRAIHPAFEIVTNPAMIFVGFVMGSLSLLVITFILGKFEGSLRTIRQAQTGIKEVDIGRVGVAMAAFNLGIGNMRRRKARTLLTTLTLLVMTFIVLSFTSIVPELQLREARTETRARYPGLLLRMPGLEPLQNAAYLLLKNEFARTGGLDGSLAGHYRATPSGTPVSRRAWFYGADIGDTGILTLARTDRRVVARALLGLDPAESAISRPQEALLPGSRWFTAEDDKAMILPLALARQLKIGAGELGKTKVRFSGEWYAVIGIYDPSRWKTIVDLDGDQLMPADFTLSKRLQAESQTGTAAFRRFIRLDPASVFLVPAATALRLGADIRSVAVGFADATETQAALKSLMPRLRVNLYAATPGNDRSPSLQQPKSDTSLRVSQFSVLQASGGSGMGLVLVQILIASVFVLNTMIASVYERTKEISIFSAIGLAPNHISMLFFAESLVYGVLGAVGGYIVAQSLAKYIVATGALPGLYLNFSSMSAVMAAGLVMGVVLLSTIYPARVAAKIAAPALNEEAFRAAPEGDEWRIELPFSISAGEAAPLVQFFGEWFAGYEAYTIGSFVTADTKTFSQTSDDLDESDRSPAHSSTASSPHASKVFIAETTVWLSPYDLGVSQHVMLEASPADVPDVYRLGLILTRTGGERENWLKVNKRFLASIRRQFLAWRTLDHSQRAAFAEKAEAASLSNREGGLVALAHERSEMGC